MEKEELNRIAYRAGVSEEDVVFFEELVNVEREFEWPDVLMDLVDD